MLRTQDITAVAKVTSSAGSKSRDAVDTAAKTAKRYARRGLSQGVIGAKCVYAGARGFVTAFFRS